MASNIVESDEEEMELSTKDVIQDIEDIGSTTVSVHSGSDSSGPTQSDSASSIITEKKSDSLTSDPQKVAENSNSIDCSKLSVKLLNELMTDMTSLAYNEIDGLQLVSILDFIEKKVKLSENVVKESRKLIDELVETIKYAMTTRISRFSFAKRVSMLENLLIVRHETKHYLIWFKIANSTLEKFYKKMCTMRLPFVSLRNRFADLVGRFQKVFCEVKSFIENLQSSVEVASKIIERLEDETGLSGKVVKVDTSGHSPKG